MRSALYYPHTEIGDGRILKTALLLWDEIHVIVPTKEYRPEYESRQHSEAFEMIGNCHVPTPDEQQEAHEIISDFAMRPLPKAFSYIPSNLPNEGNEIYELYPEKLLMSTWEMLRQGGFIGAALPNADFPASNAMGLGLMGILADCCAKDTFTRVTDRAESYASLQGLLTDDGSPAGEVAVNELVPAAVKIVNSNRLDFDRLIAFRKNEDAASRDLRHRLQKRIEEQAEIIAKSKSKTKREEALRQFESDTQDDYTLLKEALKMKTIETFASKEIIVTILGAVGMAVTAGLAAHLAMPEVATATGGAVTIGGLVATKSKFSSERRKLLQEHPTAYLYEAAGGLRL